MEFTIFTFPFEQIGWALRQLSLSGGAGNLFAIILYVLIGLIPCIAWLVLKKQGKDCKVDYLLFPISGFWLFVLYYMINPGLFAMDVAGSGKGLLGGTFYSVLVGYLVLRILKKTSGAGMQSLQKGLRILLYVVMLLFAYIVVVEFTINLPKAIQMVQEGNSVSDAILEYEGVNLTMTYIFLVLQSIVNALPYVLDMFLLFLGIKAIEELLADAYSKKAVEMIKKIGSYCKKTLAVVVVTGAVFNILQILFANQLHQISITTTIPVFSILFITVILIVARVVEENQKLKMDNDLFI